MEPLFHIALIHPEIPQNTGNIGRLCLGVRARLHLVHPIGFQVDDRAVRRAGLDYWRHVDLMEHADLVAFWSWVGERRIWCVTAHGAQLYSSVPYARDDVLVFGRESVGLGELASGHATLRIPMFGTRSLNLSNAAAVVAYSALQRVCPELYG